MDLTNIIYLTEKALYPFRVLYSYLGRFANRITGGKTRPLSLAFKVALAFFFCLAIFIAIAVVLRRFSDDGRYQLHEFTPIEILNDIIFFLIAIGISILVYFGVRLATRDRPSLYPEIDRCWESFNGWREKQSLDWFDFNRYLVLGSNVPISKAMHTEMQNKKVDALPPGANEWMHWYGTAENLYLHIKNISHTNERLDKMKSRSQGSTSFADGGTLQVSVGVPGWSEEVGISDAHTNQVDYGESVMGFGASLDPNQSLDPGDSMGPENTASESNSNDGEPQDFYNEDDDTRAERLEYLVKLIRSKTEGEVPFHGVVVTLPFDKFLQRENYKAIAAAVRKDLLDLRIQSEIAFPVAFVFTSMEKDKGFPKLQNLLGEKRASTGRFGSGCQVEEIPTVEKDNLELQLQRACNSFEDWVINRWAKSSQLARAAQNKELYKLTIRVRQQFQNRLRHLLEESLIWSPADSPNGEATDLSLTGCYFTATGDSQAERGFLTGVFGKCEEFAKTSCWSEKAISSDRLFSVAASLLILLSLGMIGSIVFFLFSSVWG